MSRAGDFLNLLEKTNPFGNDKYVFLGKWVAETMQTIEDWNGKGTEQSIAYKNLVKQLLKKYGKIIGVGSFRAVMTTNSGYVVKVPLCPNGEEDNRLEFELFKKSPYAHHFATCKLVEVQGKPLLFMEELTGTQRGETGVKDLKIVDPEDPDPLWIQKLDARQIGASKSGKIKAFDYSRDFWGDPMKKVSQ